MDTRCVGGEGTHIQLQDGRAGKVDQFKGGGPVIRVLKNRVWVFASTEGYDRHRAADSLDTAVAMNQVSSWSHFGRTSLGESEVRN